jgi:hypothetical protein
MYAIIVVAIIVLLIHAHVSSEYYYNNVLKNAFEKLKYGKEIRTLNPEMNWNIINMNIDGYINNKKIIFNQPNHSPKSSYTEFTNKNALAAFMNNVLVVDIDSNEPLVLDDKPIAQYLPKTTVTAKTPHGYHYYFYNDTNDKIPCYVGLKINNKRYPVDLLTGTNQLIFLPPTRIESECYRWINSPFTHHIEPISKHMHLLDLFAHTKEFSIPSEPANACVSHSIPNLLCIVWDFQIIYQLKYKCTASPFEQLHSNQHELMYRSNTTHYLFFKHNPMKNYTAHDFVQHVADLMEKHNINGGIVHLGCGHSHKLNSNDDNIAQFNSCRVHDYNRHGLTSPVVIAEQTLVQTSVFTHRPIHIISKDIMHETNLRNQHEDDTRDDDRINSNHNHVVNEDMFLIFMLSNQTHIPCACLVHIMSSGETKDDAKCIKLVQYYIRNVLNATHHTSNPSKMLTFFDSHQLEGHTAWISI